MKYLFAAILLSAVAEPAAEPAKDQKKVRLDGFWDGAVLDRAGMCDNMRTSIMRHAQKGENYAVSFIWTDGTRYHMFVQISKIAKPFEGTIEIESRYYYIENFDPKEKVWSVEEPNELTWWLSLRSASLNAYYFISGMADENHPSDCSWGKVDPPGKEG